MKSIVVWSVFCLIAATNSTNSVAGEIIKDAIGNKCNLAFENTGVKMMFEAEKSLMKIVTWRFESKIPCTDAGSTVIMMDNNKEFGRGSIKRNGAERTALMNDNGCLYYIYFSPDGVHDVSMKSDHAAKCKKSP